eukprot:1155333-Pelagomonas_calceolata.AAC.11
MAHLVSAFYAWCASATLTQQGLRVGISACKAFYSAHFVQSMHKPNQARIPFVAGMHSCRAFKHASCYVLNKVKVGTQTDILPSMKLKRKPPMRPSPHLVVSPCSKNMWLLACHAPKHEGENTACHASKHAACCVISVDHGNFIRDDKNHTHLIAALSTHC